MANTVALVPVQTRDERPASYNPADFPSVTGREFVWHLTPIEKLSSFLDGAVNSSQQPWDVETVGSVTTSWISMNDEIIGSAGVPEELASALAWSSVENAFLVDIGADDVSQVTLTRSLESDSATAAHTIVRVAPFSKTTLVFLNEGLAQLTENVEILAGESSDITIVTLQQWAPTSKHLASHFIKLDRDAQVKHVVVSLSGEIVRINPQARLVGAGSSVSLLGLYFADSNEHLEHQVFVDHIGAKTKSRVTYKGALQGAGARTVWIGDVLIGPDAVGTDSYEQNRNLVLTDGTRADSIPNLEIKTGDIVGAGHASATGRFDDEQLFYLQARGVSEEEARRLVVRGFLNEVVQQIGVESVEARIHEALDRELSEVISRG